MNDGPALPKSYWLSALVTILALVPELISSTAAPHVQGTIARTLFAMPQTLTWIGLVGTAGYATGCVLAAELARRIDRRRLLCALLGVSVAAELLAAVAPNALAFGIGRVVQGGSAGMLIIVALPPLLVDFPVERIKPTVSIAVIVLFGAASAGPLIGGYVAQLDAWRALFVAEAGMSLGGLVLAYLGSAQRDPAGPNQRFDAGALIYTCVGVCGVFFGVGQIATGAGIGAPIVVVPLAIGLVALAVLLVTEFRAEEPLLPVKPLSTAFPLMGTITAMVSGAAYVALLQISSTFLTTVPALTPLRDGLAVWPNVVTTAVGGALFVVSEHALGHRADRRRPGDSGARGVPAARADRHLGLRRCCSPLGDCWSGRRPDGRSRPLDRLFFDQAPVGRPRHRPRRVVPFVGDVSRRAGVAAGRRRVGGPLLWAAREGLAGARDGHGANLLTERRGAQIDAGPARAATAGDRHGDPRRVCRALLSPPARDAADRGGVRAQPRG